jgi:hypothetical protein
MIADAAYCQDKRIEMENSLSKHNVSISVLRLLQVDCAVLIVYRRERTLFEGEAVSSSVRSVGNLIALRIDVTRRHLVQKWFPEMRGIPVNENNLRISLLPQPIS